MAGYYAAVQWMPPPLGRQLPHGPRIGFDLPRAEANASQNLLEQTLSLLHSSLGGWGWNFEL